MIEHTDNFNQVTNPEQAVQEFLGEQFVEWLMEYIKHYMDNSPTIRLITSAKPNPARLKKFILQLFLANQAFLGAKETDPGFLRFAIANLSEVSDPTAENALEILELRQQEELVSQGVNRELWRRFLQALGATSEEIERSEPKEATRNYTSELSDVYSTSEWQTAIGAFAAGEWIASTEHQAVLTMLKNNTSLADKDLVVLKSTQHPTHILDKVTFDSQTKSLVWEGAKRQLEAHQSLLKALVKYLRP